MKNILCVSHLDKSSISNLLDRAWAFKHLSKLPDYGNAKVASLFYENSTRTKVSFELAAKQLNMKHITVDLTSSSEHKGEALLDTLKILHAMGIQYFIFRHKQENLIQTLSNELKTASFINAGDGMHAHPTQTLLDLLTIKENKQQFDGLKVVISGDIKHSRVANSLIAGLSIMGVSDICLSTPDFFLPVKLDNTVLEPQLDKALEGADVVVSLRVQKERIRGNVDNELDSYRKAYQLTDTLLSKAKQDAIVMHPGPMNRGIEITSAVADGPQSVIFQQVSNGVFVRMAVLEYVLNHNGYNCTY